MRKSDILQSDRSPVIIIILIIWKNECALVSVKREVKRTENKIAKLTTPANFLLPFLQRSSQRVSHTSLSTTGSDTRRRQPAPVRARICSSAGYGSRAAIANLGTIHLLQRTDAARLLDTIE